MRKKIQLKNNQRKGTLHKFQSSLPRKHGSIRVGRQRDFVQLHEQNIASNTKEEMIGSVNIVYEDDVGTENKSYFDSSNLNGEPSVQADKFEWENAIKNSNDIDKGYMCDHLTEVTESKGIKENVASLRNNVKEIARAHGEPLMSYDMVRDAKTRLRFPNSNLDENFCMVTSAKEARVKIVHSQANAGEEQCSMAEEEDLINPSSTKSNIANTIRDPRRNPPINPSIIVTTEPFAQIATMQASNECKETERAKLKGLDMLDRTLPLTDQLQHETTKPMGTVSQKQKSLDGSASKTSRLDFNSNERPITDINEVHGTIEESDNICNGNKIRFETEKQLVTAIPPSDIKKAREAFESRQAPLHTYRRKVSREHTEPFTVYKVQRQTQTEKRRPMDDTISQLRRTQRLPSEKNSFQNIDRSSESSFKSTDGEVLSSDVSVPGSEMRGVFRNLKEQHKMIEKRSDALINFKPHNRCDTRLISSPYELASALETRRGAKNHLMITNDEDLNEFSKPSTNTSYFNIDEDNFSSRETKIKTFSPNWLYVVSLFVIWNAVLAFIHAIDDASVSTCSNSIKWRLWCTIAVFSVVYCLLEILYEKKRKLKSLLSSFMVLALLIIANEQPLSCYSSESNKAIINQVRASLNILIAIILFIYWLRRRYVSSKGQQNEFKLKTGRKLSQLPIANYENRI